MALKSIIEVEIDDGRFRKFNELFTRYQDQLLKVPGAWSQVNKEMGKTHGLVDKLILAAGTQNAQSKKQNDEAEKNNGFLGGASRLWTGMTAAVVDVERRIVSITKNLLKWTGLTTLFTGLLGAGGLYGLDKLANSVAHNRRSAMGLGVSYGQQAAFNTNYSRFINPGSFLNNVAGAKYDMTSDAYRALLALGISPSDIASKNAADLSQQTLEKLPGFFPKSMDRGMIGAKAKAYGVDQLMTLPELMAYLNASNEERKATSERYKTDATKMDMTDAVTRKWQDFTTQLSRATERIKVVFMDKLSALEPSLEKLSNSVLHVIEAFADSGALKEWIDAFAGGLDKLADGINSPEFRKGVKDFGNWLVDAAKAIWNFIASFGGKMDPPSSPDPGSVARGPPSFPVTPPSATRLPWRGRGASTMTLPPPAHGAADARHGAFEPTGELHAAGRLLDDRFPNTVAGREAYIRMRAAQIGVDPDFAVAVGMAEGLGQHTGNQASIVDRDAAGNPFSFWDFQLNYRNGLGRAAAEQGIDPSDPNNWQRADDFSLRYMHDHGLRPWHNDRAVERYRSAGRLPTVIIHPNTGGNPHTAAFLTSHSSNPARER